MSIRWVLTDEQWAKMEPHCLGKPSDPGRSGTDNRRFVEAVLWIARTGSPWRDLPPEFGKWNTVFKRFRDWLKADVFQRLFDAVSEQPDMEYAMVDATIVKVHRHGQGAKGGLRARPEAYAAAGAVLDGMAGKVYRLGDKAGAGSKVKIINQLLAGVHIAVAAEAMALGLREGVEASALYEVITNSAGNSWMFENRMAHVLAGDYTPLSAVDIFVKDLGLVLDTARASKFPLPLAATAHQMFMQASTAGFAKEDDSAVIKIFPGITLPEGKDKA